MIIKHDDSLAYYLTPRGPVARIATENGYIVLSTSGMRIIKEGKTTMLSFSESKQIANILTQIVMNDLKI